MHMNESYESEEKKPLIVTGGMTNVEHIQLDTVVIRSALSSSVNNLQTYDFSH